jgi:hypothetical protein
MEIEMNRFDQLVQDLKDGKLNMTHIQIAYRAYLREGKDVPDEIKDLLGGRSEAMSGVIYSIFKLVREVEGTVELAYNRGYQAGQEDKK